MARRHDQLRIRLIQVRERPAVLQEEQATFRERCRLRPEQLLPTNALHDPLDEHLLDDVDALFLGGAGAYSATHTYPFTAPLIRLLHTCAEHALPVFGSCWGHQFLARAFGGRVEHDLARSEMGTHAVELTEAGREDVLLGNFPPRFYAQMGHQDRVVELPSEAVELARNATAPYQAFRLGDLPIYGTQFHSELDAERERQRLLAYRPYYTEVWGDDEGRFEQILASLRDTPEVDGLLYAFLQRFCVEDGNTA